MQQRAGTGMQWGRVARPHGIFHCLLDPERCCMGIVAIFFSCLKVWYLQARNVVQWASSTFSCFCPLTILFLPISARVGEEGAGLTQLSGWKKPCVETLSSAESSSWEASVGFHPSPPCLPRLPWTRSACLIKDPLPPLL